MEAFYEDFREQDTTLRIMRNERHFTRAHFHNNVEVYLLLEGAQRIVCNGKTYDMQSGDVAFFDSYDIHGYVPTKEPCKNSCVLIIPFYFLLNFRSFRKKMKVSTPIIRDKELTEKLLYFIDEVLVKTEDKNVKAATVDIILAFLEEKLVYTADENEDVNLLKQILGFIEKNFKGDARLSTIAKNLGYTEEHLSREFHKFLKESIPTYVNRLRLDYVDFELKRGEKKLSQIIYEAGFNNFQTYYRNKKRFEDK